MRLRVQEVTGMLILIPCYDKGALCCISEQELPGEKRPYIQVESSLQALKDIAQLYRANLDIKVVGITGSVGKTSTKENDCFCAFTENSMCIRHRET